MSKFLSLATVLVVLVATSTARAQHQPETHTPSQRPSMAPPVHDNPIWAFILVDQLENAFSHGEDQLQWNALGWVGGDYNRLWFNLEGAYPYGGKLQDADAQLLYGRLIAPYWDLQAGVRYSRLLPGGPDRGSAVLALQGLAPYWFETQIAAFVSHKGEVSARIEAEYDLLFTQRLIAQPRFETNLSAQRVEELGVGRWANDVELGLRLRYEIMREIAPYVGVSWTRALGQSADFARAREGEVSKLSALAGVRLWY
jgi:copper resistance protein B